MFQRSGLGALDYNSCAYGKSRISFRGPKVDLDAPYIAFLGGTETFGRYVAEPFPALVGEQTGLQVMNLGATNAGLDLYWANPDLMELIQGAALTVMQIMGASNMSNRFYSVHPRRNDRFVKANAALNTVFPRADLTEVHFTRHLLARLKELRPERFYLVVDELQAAWQSRMEMILAQCRSPTVLLSIETAEARQAESDDPAGADPLFVTPEMLSRLRPMVNDVVVVRPSIAAVGDGVRELVFPASEIEVAAQMLSAKAHREIADIAGGAIKALLH